MNKILRVAVSGQPGSDPFAFARLLAKELDLAFFSHRGLQRQYADAQGISIAEIERLMEYSTIDVDIGEYIRHQMEEQTRVVVEGPMAFRNLPNAFCITLIGPEALRHQGFRDRARQIYDGIDIYDRKHYHLGLDTVAMPFNEQIMTTLAILRGAEAVASFYSRTTAKR